MSLLTDLDIVNTACAKIGVEPVQSMDDETPEGQSVDLIYREARDFNLGVYLFSFSRQLRQLSRVADLTPKSGFLYVYDLPSDAVGAPLYVTDDITDPDHRFNRYALLGGQVHADPEPLFASIRIVPPVHEWSGPFRTAMVDSLASRFAMAMASDRNTSEMYHQRAYGTATENFRGGSLGAAIREDAQATPPRRAAFENNPLTRAWRGTG